MRCNLYKNPSRFLRTEIDDIILNAKIFKGSRIFTTVLTRSTARETHDQMFTLTTQGKVETQITETGARSGSRSGHVGPPGLELTCQVRRMEKAKPFMEFL